MLHELFEHSQCRSTKAKLTCTLPSLMISIFNHLNKSSRHCNWVSGQSSRERKCTLLRYTLMDFRTNCYVSFLLPQFIDRYVHHGIMRLVWNTSGETVKQQAASPVNVRHQFRRNLLRDLQR